MQFAVERHFIHIIIQIEPITRTQYSLVFWLWISKLIMPEKTWKGIKTVFLKIKFTIYIAKLLNLGVDITPHNSTL